MQQMHITASDLVKQSSVPKSAVSHFLHNRYNKAGKNNCKAIREACYQIGILQRPKSRKPSECRNCGTQYPTRKIQNVHATVNDRVEGFTSLDIGQVFPSADQKESSNA
jgi:hypothetical protein